MTSYIESAAGVAAGGRSGVTAIVTGVLFLCSLVAAPFVSMVPTAATAPALIVVGSLMLHTLGEIEWKQPLIAFPAFLTLVLIPLTTSIANGLGFGLLLLRRCTWRRGSSGDRIGCCMCWRRCFWRGLFM